MKMKSVNKTQFARLNDKRFHFHNGIFSLPFGHFFKIKLEKKKKSIE